MRRRTPKDGELLLRWSEKEDDLECAYGAGCVDGLGIAFNAFTREHIRVLSAYQGQPEFLPSFLDELKARGYDLSTLNFSIQKKRS
jgi:hypothetical protein